MNALFISTRVCKHYTGTSLLATHFHHSFKREGIILRDSLLLVGSLSPPGLPRPPLLLCALPFPASTIR